MPDDSLTLTGWPAGVDPSSFAGSHAGSTASLAAAGAVAVAAAAPELSVASARAGQSGQCGACAGVGVAARLRHQPFARSEVPGVREADGGVVHHPLPDGNLRGEGEQHGCRQRCTSALARSPVAPGADELPTGSI